MKYGYKILASLFSMALILAPFHASAADMATQVRLQTSMGDIILELNKEKAPNTVQNFLDYVQKGHYDGTIFHQVIRDYVALAGGYTTDLEEKKTHFAIRNEAYNQLSNTRGTIAMARQPDLVDSSTCQFFFNLADNPELDHKSRANVDEYGYCVFGQVLDGMDVLDQISQAPVADKNDFTSVPVEPIVIQSVTPAPK